MITEQRWEWRFVVVVLVELPLGSSAGLEALLLQVVLTELYTTVYIVVVPVKLGPWLQSNHFLPRSEPNN